MKMITAVICTTNVYTANSQSQVAATIGTDLTREQAFAVVNKSLTTSPLFKDEPFNETNKAAILDYSRTLKASIYSPSNQATLSSRFAQFGAAIRQEQLILACELTVPDDAVEAHPTIEHTFILKPGKEATVSIELIHLPGAIEFYSESRAKELGVAETTKSLIDMSKFGESGGCTLL